MVTKVFKCPCGRDLIPDPCGNRTEYVCLPCEARGIDSGRVIIGGADCTEWLHESVARIPPMTQTRADLLRELLAPGVAEVRTRLAAIPEDRRCKRCGWDHDTSNG